MNRSDARRSRHVALYLACALLCFLSTYSLLRAQGSASTIVGTVTDPSGAAVAGVTITITNTNTGIISTMQTDATGSFSAPDLAVGVYKVTAAAKGFKTGERTGIRLDYQQTQRADFVLVLGNVAESITVEAGATPIQTDEASSATVVSEKQVTDLPLNGRNFLQLAQLVPGTTEGSPGSGNSGFTETGFSLSVYGQRDFDNQYTLDGVDMTEARNPSPMFLPSIDAIQEFDVKSGLYGAQYGTKGGAHVDIAIKSGTNSLHGSAYEFVRNYDMDARNFFAPTTNPLRRNQFGGTIGGAIKKDKLFFFGAYDGTRQTENATEISVVPTPAMINGDFSAFTTPIINPATGAQFPGNQVTNIDPNAKILNQFWPAPNYSNGPLNYIKSSASFDHWNQEFARIDYNISEKDRIFGRFATSNRKTGDPAAIDQFTDVDPFIANNVAFQWIHVFTPHVLNSLLLGVSYYHREYDDENTYNSVAQQLTIPHTHDNPILEGIPWMGIVGYATIGDESFSPLIFHNQNVQIADNLTLQKGKHSITVGGTIERFRFDQTFLSWPRGYFDFEGIYTGNSFSDYLLGLPHDTDVAQALTPGELFDTQWSIYVQDDWKVKPNLTINAGLRYEVMGAMHDAHGRGSNWDITTGQGFGAGSPVPLFNTDYGDIAPRLSFAYRPTQNGKTVIRGGAGVFYSQPEGNLWADANLNPPLGETLGYVSSTNTPLTFENPYPSSSLQPSGLPTFFADDKRFLNGRTYLWNLDVQRMLAGNILLDVGYTGSRTVHLMDNSMPNNTLPGPGNPLLSLPYPTVGDVLYYTPNAFSTYEGLAVKVEKRMSNGLYFLTSFTYSQALDLTQSPIFGDGYGGSAPQNPKDLWAEKGLASFDLKYRLSTSFGYELPFGHGKRFASQMNRGEEYLLGGWQLNGILTAETGNPFTPWVPTNTANVAWQNGERPNRIANGNWSGSQRTLSEWFDTSAFTPPAPYTYGSSGRDVLIGPGYGNLDLSLFKNLEFEKVRFQLRGEAFNITNHANFNPPGNSIGTSTFGVISSAKDPRILQVALKIIF